MTRGHSKHPRRHRDASRKDAMGIRGHSNVLSHTRRTRHESTGHGTHQRLPPSRTEPSRQEHALQSHSHGAQSLTWDSKCRRNNKEDGRVATAAQSVEHLTLDVGSDHGLRVIQSRLSPESGILSLLLSLLPLVCAHFHALSLSNK